MYETSRRVMPLNDSAFEAVDRMSSRLLEAGEPDNVVESITGHLSRLMLEHYSDIRLNAKKAHSRGCPVGC
jgi:intergrase/recombinase